MSIWAWIQPVDRIWKVLTDPEEGTVKVYDEKNEEEFLKIVATKLIEDGNIKDENIGKEYEYNSMYA